MSDLLVPAEFTVEISLSPKHLSKQLNQHLLHQLKSHYEGKCHHKKGYIQKGSLNLISKSPGYLVENGFEARIKYNVKFSCLIQQPVQGTVVICIINKVNELIGAAAVPVKNLPYQILIPKSLETNEENRELLDKLTVGDRVAVTVVGSRLIPSDMHNRRAKYQIVARLQQTLATHELKQYELPTDVSDAQLVLNTKTTVDPDNYEPWQLRDLFSSARSWNGLVEVNEQIKILNDSAELLPAAEKTLWNKVGDRTFWNLLKARVNKYELVTELSPIKADVASRAFYKMHEMIQFEGDLFRCLVPRDMRILNLAESPGGFIQAIIYNRNYHQSSGSRAGSNYRDFMMAVSINEIEGDRKPLLWKRLQDRTKNSSLPQFKTVEFERFNPDRAPLEGMGERRGLARVALMPEEQADLLDVDNIEQIAEYYQEHGGADLVTADGGIPAEDYQRKEMMHYQLFFAEALTALASQAPGGTFILKLYDLLTEFTVDLVMFLSLYYDTVSLFKPYTSRQANSEKYLVCTGFNGNLTEDRLEQLKQTLRDWPGEPRHVVKVFQNLISEEFKDKIKIFNSEFINIEMFNRSEGLQLGRELLEMTARERQDRLDAIRTIQASDAQKFLRQLGLLEG